MYNINYYKQLIKEDNASLKLFLQACVDKKIFQPKIFCDNYYINMSLPIPIFHSSYIRHHFDQSLILIDYEDLSYAQIYDKNYLIFYNPELHNIDKTNAKHQYISLQDDFYNFLSENCGSYEKI
jgi:hypothetical protein